MWAAVQLILSRWAAVVEVLAPAELFLEGKVLGAGDLLAQKSRRTRGIAPAGLFLWGKVLGAGDLLEKSVGP